METFKNPNVLGLTKQEASFDENKKYSLPVKLVKNLNDMTTWQKSEAYYDLVGFINGISYVIQGKKLSHNCEITETMKKLLQIFDKLNQLIDETPKIDQPQRFGNAAYRIWSKKMRENAQLYLINALPEKYYGAITELVVYFMESFGNQTRIDYGTGHELCFVMFLCCLFKIEALKEVDNVACGLVLFNAYLLLVRRLQLYYRMEPAGSQGVWSLDDYQFVPFIWGSAQLSLNSPFEPSKFLDDFILDNFSEDYMFISCIQYISKVKTGHFAEHSNQLWSISAVPSWNKINAGLVKMYQKEILAKFPVIQHVYFGDILKLKLAKPERLINFPRLGIEASDKPKEHGPNLNSGDIL